MVMVSGGYPGVFKKGFEVSGLADVDGSVVFHGGTALSGDKVLTDGGRLFAVSSYGDDIEEARDLSLKNASRIEYEGRYFRNDIGFDLIDL
jgi:phosphoribosylamine--glycine ligase